MSLGGWCMVAPVRVTLLTGGAAKAPENFHDPFEIFGDHLLHRLLTTAYMIRRGS
jgi:hypothetical protein